jgi:hypothetical protein
MRVVTDCVEEFGLSEAMVQETPVIYLRLGMKTSSLLEEAGNAALPLLDSVLALRCWFGRCRLELLRHRLVFREGLPDSFLFGDKVAILILDFLLLHDPSATASSAVGDCNCGLFLDGFGCAYCGYWCICRWCVGHLFVYKG